MKKTGIIIVGGIGLLVGVWAVFFRGGSAETEIEYRYAPITKGELVRSISATGQLVALTTVDIKSKAGGKIVKLNVTEGTEVKKGDLIAEIDPSDTQATYDQAKADLDSANARAIQAAKNLELQLSTGGQAVKDAEIALESAKSRLRRAELEADRQPTLSKANLATAESNLKAAQQAFDRMREVTIPQRRRDTAGALNRARVALENAQSDLTRQQGLLEKGYVAASALERARNTLEAARADFDNAKLRQDTLEKDIQADLVSTDEALKRAQADLEQAKANQSQVDTSKQSLLEAQKAVAGAEVALARAKANLLTNDVRRQDEVAARASTVRNEVSLKNAKVQLDSTTVLAPRDGVVTIKYLEEGTIIPPGTSTFAQGTSIVQLSDTTQMFVECAVDEADIAQVHEKQNVRVIVEAFPSAEIRGTVERVNPSATTTQNVTAVKVRVKILPGSKVKLLPGMNATCEFLTLEKKDVLIAPSQAIQRDGDKIYVKVKNPSPTGQPIRREVTIGESGNDGVEILSGLKEGEEVVVAEIDLKAMRETQQKMLEAQQGGGLAGGTGPGGGRRPGQGGGGAGGGARPSGGGTTGGARPGGMGR
ncbi:MAG: efflux RND transporter periplasmic adaptor subunit [Fimbriimonadaceae bacterium]|nr:efflux RND transporter periplasmic adaptor subunit [Fimbriimonadaceae bacterium]